MSDRIVQVRMMVVMFGVIVTALSVTIPLVNVSSTAAVSLHPDDGLLTVTFLDVGQGDAIFIETPDGIQALIDGGPDASVLRELGAQMPFWDRTIDLVLATHPDKDHVGGLVDVLARYDVDIIVRTENDSDTAVSSAFIFSTDEETSNIHITQAGEVIRLGEGTTLTVYSPTGDAETWESNTSSIVAKLTYGEIDFMLTGDAPVGIEEYLVKTYGTALNSEVLKLGHHGSETSSGQAFLEAVAPEYAIVSAGADNRYGHPHAEVVERVQGQGIRLLSTAFEGAISFKSDGKRVWLE